jgi:hypothetical protein
LQSDLNVRQSDHARAQVCEEPYDFPRKVGHP